MAFSETDERLPTSCGLRVAMVFDVSSSITSSPTSPEVEAISVSVLPEVPVTS